jgi:hypothetical protein
MKPERTALAAATLVAALLSTGCGGSTNGGRDADGGEGDETAASSDKPRGQGHPLGEPEVDYDRATGVVRFHHKNGPLVLDAKHDSACVRLPTHGPIIEQILRTA